MRRTNWLPARCAVVLISLALAACGGSSKTPPKPRRTATSSPPPTAAAPTTTGGSSVVTTGGVHATLTGPNHAPVVNHGWPYTVVVMDASGHPLSGTVTVQFVFAGQVVGRDTPPTHPLKNGRWHDILKFPARSTGIPLIFQTVVRTSGGTVTLNWPVKVKP